jgi:hypothetical protein
MNAPLQGRVVKTALAVTTFLAGMLLAAPILAAVVDKTASIEASGEGVIFDVKATKAGTLKVGTKAGRVGDRWRVTIGEVNTSTGAVSAVGTGKTNGFTGFASKTVAAGKLYVVLVTWERPLPGTFPAKVTVRFDGTPPVVQVDGKPLSSIVPRPACPGGGGPGPTPTCPADGAEIGCDALLACEFKPAGETDAFKIQLPANSDLSVTVSGENFPFWDIFDPKGNRIKSCGGRCQVALTAAGIYTIEAYEGWDRAGAYTLSVLGISTPYRCGPPIIPGASPTKGKFDRAGDTDSYQLNGVKAGETYSINITGDNSPRWEIFDPSGNRIGSRCYGKCAVTLPVAGGYTIEASEAWNRAGAYSLSVQKVGG